MLGIHFQEMVDNVKSTFSVGQASTLFDGPAAAGLPGVWLALDGGGTSTRCVVVTSTGECLGFGQAGSGNPISVGLGPAMAAIADSVTGALVAAGVAPDRVRGVHIALAGGSVDEPLEDALASSLGRIGVTAPMTLHPDPQAAFCSGTHEEAGYLLLAGTGAAALRIEGGECVATADGLGWLLGDVGSGFWIGHQVATAALDDLDRRGPATALTRLVAAELGLAWEAGQELDVEYRPALLKWIVTAIYADRPVRLARFAQLAFRAEGDPVAEAIVDRAAQGLVNSFNTVRVPGLVGPVVLAGGVLARQPRLVARVAAAAGWNGDAGPTRHTVADGLAGAVVLGLRHMGVGVDATLFEAVTTSLARLR